MDRGNAAVSAAAATTCTHLPVHMQHMLECYLPPRMHTLTTHA